MELREEIYANPARPWSIQELADQVSLSPAYFQDLYKKAFQVSCGADIIQSRIGQAKRMLAQTNLTMEEIADRCGITALCISPDSFASVQDVHHQVARECAGRKYDGCRSWIKQYFCL